MTTLQYKVELQGDIFGPGGQGAMTRKLLSFEVLAVLLATKDDILTAL